MKRVVSVIPVEDAAATHNALPGEEAGERKQFELHPALSVEPAKAAGAATSAKSF